jgi:hypothetical protein
VTVEYFKSRVLVPDVDVTVKDISTIIPVTIATKKTDPHGRAEFTLADFNNIPLDPAKTYQLEVARTENIMSHCSSFYRGITISDFVKCMAVKPMPSAEDIMLGDVSDDPPMAELDMIDCNAINAFTTLCGITPCPVNMPPACIPSPVAILKTGEWRFLAPVTIPVASPVGQIQFFGTSAKKLFAFKAFRLGDLNTSWTPPPPPGSATAPTPLIIDPGTITITTATCIP